MKLRLLILLFVFSMVFCGCKRPPCPTYMTPEEVKELRPASKKLTKRGTVKKKSPSNRIK